MDNSCREKIISEDYVDFIINNSETDYSKCVQLISDEWSIVYEPIEEIEKLSFGRYGYYPIPKLFGFMDKSALTASGVIAVREQNNLNLTGKNVIMGFIEGIDYRHEAFRDDYGNSRILAIWDQTNNEGTPPQGFLYGTEILREEINKAIEDGIDIGISDEHGTFVAGIAAGNDNGRDFSGVAPDSDIIAVKMRQAKGFLRDFYRINQSASAYSESDIMAAVSYLVSMAEKLDRPLVICMGIGTSYGPHTSGTPLAQYLDKIALNEKTVVVTAAGNEGNSRGHYLGEFIEEETTQIVEFRVGEGERGFLMELWGRQPDSFSVEIVTPGGESTGEIGFEVNERNINFIVDRTTLSVYNNAVATLDGGPRIVMKFNNPTAGIWQIRVRRENLFLGYYNIWLPIKQFLSSDTFFLTPSPYITVTMPGTATNVITTAAYNSRNNSIWLEGSRGYAANGIVKPEIAAPGVDVFGPVANTLNRYTQRSGSSYACAFTAGVAALLMEWRFRLVPGLIFNTSDVKSLLILGAERDSERSYPNPSWGYGRINIQMIFERLAGLR